MNLNQALLRGKLGFSILAPGPPSLAKARGVKYFFKVLPIAKLAKKVYTKKYTPSKALGEYLGGKVFGKLIAPVSRQTYNFHFRAYNKRSFKNGVGGRTWISGLDANKDGRIIKTMTIMYHDADRAGKHLDIHIGHLSLIIRVSGKPVESKIVYTSTGELTQASKEALVQHIREEIFAHSRVPQNLDHSISNARSQWLYTENHGEGYGSGATRQLVAESKVEFYHTDDMSTLHMYSPLIDRDQGLYLYRLYNGFESGTPVCIWGRLNPREPKFEDRLHLKMELDKERFYRKIDKRTLTRKYDGASAHWYASDRGTKYYSPRVSKRTGHRIEYTWKMAEASNAKGSSKGMGEIVYWRYIGVGHLLEPFDVRGIEGVTWEYLTAAEIGGVLNSSQIRPSSIYLEYRVYRVDEWYGRNVILLPFEDNRRLQKEFSKNHSIIRPVRKTHIATAELFQWEGLVAVPHNTSIVHGYKWKRWGDMSDWQVEDIQLYISEKDNIAGVVWFKSLESDKRFKLGPGQIGTAEQCLDMIDNPSNYEGRVAKVASRHGHEGRAAKLKEWHLDK